MSRRMRAAALAAALFLPAAALAAETTGSLAGVVVDASTQAPLAGASVTARSPALVGEQTALTDDNGRFEVTLLPPGTYDLTVKHDGFEPFAPAGLVLKGRRVLIRLALAPLQAPPPAAPLEAAIEFNDASMTAPAIVSGPAPEYSQEALERGVEGLMSVRCTVTAAGAVRRCKVLKGLPYMDRPVIDALEARKYKPAMASGKPLDVLYTFTIRLKLPAQ
jgi:TonB family protein